MSPRRKAHECLDLRYGAQTTYTYDSASQMTNIMHQLTATSTPINKADYVYNSVDNRTSLTDRRGAQNFGYDRSGSLNFCEPSAPPRSASLRVRSGRQ